LKREIPQPTIFYNNVKVLFFDATYHIENFMMINKKYHASYNNGHTSLN